MNLLHPSTMPYYYQVLFLLSSIIASFRPVFFRTYKANFLLTIVLSLLSMYVGYLVLTYVKNPKQSFEDYKKSISRVYTRENMFYSILSELRFIAKQYSFMLLPLTFSVPISLLYIPFTMLYNHYSNKIDFSPLQLLTTGILIFGILLTKDSKTGGSPSRKSSSNSSFLQTFLKSLTTIENMQSLKGILYGLFAAIAGSYLYVVLDKIDKSTQDPLYVMGIESGFSLLVFSLLLAGAIFMGKVTLPSWGTIVKMFMFLTFLFNIDIVLKYIGLEKVTIIQSLFLSQVYLISSFLIGFFYYKEHISTQKMIGLLVVVLSSIYGSYINRS
jgi:drug/metabolite transporter (DMT)-like permease